MIDPLACPDPLAERRFNYARELANEGDWRAAAELCEQTLELVPGWAPALTALARMREKLGDREGAKSAFRESLKSDPLDLQGAGPRLALLEGRNPRSLPASYVTRLFDDYAPHFEAHLVGALGYCAPEIIVGALTAVAAGRRFAQALDLGCGSGLMGRALRSRVERLAGVDLSSRMIAKAHASGVYDELAVGDLVAFLSARPPGGTDLVVAADTLIYLGDLGPVFAAAAHALAAGGLFAFTVESGETAAFELHDHLRFRHSDAHIGQAAAAAGLKTLWLAEASTRREGRQDTPGRVAALAKG